MQMIILSIHLLVCVCLIGLVLLQRSEGGALGIGGGGGALMSGRGAGDALAQLTSIAGALFLGVSLLLTWLSGAGDGPGRSVFDALPAISAPAAPGEQAPPVEETAPTTPDPTQSSLPASTELAEAILPGPSSASAAQAPLPPSARAAPIEAQPASAQRSAPASTPRTPPPAQRSETATTQTASGTTAQRQIPAPIPTAVSGVSLVEPTTPESVDLGNGIEAVRRERAGPEQ